MHCFSFTKPSFKNIKNKEVMDKALPVICCTLWKKETWKPKAIWVSLIAVIEKIRMHFSLLLQFHLSLKHP